MFKKISLIFLFLTLINLTKCLKSNDVCFQNQKECKGFYDKQENYQLKCEPIRCSQKLSFQCGLGVCTKNITECNEYNKLNLYIQNLVTTKTNISDTSNEVKHLKERFRFRTFIKHVQICSHKIYKFNPDDFCYLSKRECFEKNIEIMRQNFSCKCPTNQSFICGKYCAFNSISCDFYKKNGKKIDNNIKDCENRNTTAIFSFFKYNINNNRLIVLTISILVLGIIFIFILILAIFSLYLICFKRELINHF